MRDFSADLPLIALPFQLLEFNDGVVLKRGSNSLIVYGTSALHRVLLILSLSSNSAISCHEIKSHFPSRDHEDIDLLLQRLFEKKFLAPHSEKRAMDYSPEDIFYDQFGTNTSEVSKKLSNLHLAFCGINSISASLFDCFQNMGVSNMSFYDDPILRNFNFINAEGEHGSKMTSKIIENTIDQIAFDKKLKEDKISALIATSDFGGQSLLLKWNKICQDRHIHFYPIYIQEMVAYAGPITIPGETPCLDCLRHRQNANLKDVNIRDLIDQNATNAQIVAASHPSISNAISNIAMYELIHFYGKFPQPHPERLVKLTLPESKLESKRVLKVPRCPTCSNFNKTSEIQLRKMRPMQKL